MSAGIMFVVVPGSVVDVVVVLGSLSVPVMLTAPIVSPVPVTGPVVTEVPVILSLTEPAVVPPSEALPVGVSCVIEPSLAVIVAVTVVVADADAEARPSSSPPHADTRPTATTTTKLMFVRCMIRLLMLTATLAANPSPMRGNPLPPARYLRGFSRVPPAGRAQPRDHATSRTARMLAQVSRLVLYP